MNQDTKDPNLDVYNAQNVASHYAALDYLSPCESLLFEAYLKSGMTILDLGVGGGRTTPYLAKLAARYVGLDYAPQMIAACRQKFPNLEFLVSSADDLSTFEACTFDAAIMAFNGMDYVLPDEARFRALQEIDRVLKPGGVLIFSSHNPRAIVVRPSWGKHRAEGLARRFSGGLSAIYVFLKVLLTVAAAVVAIARSAWGTLLRSLRRLPTRAFWRGEGNLFDPSHGGLVTHCATPDAVIRELSRFGYRLLQVLGDDYPRSSGVYVTFWYYYVFAKAETPASQAPCA